MNIAKVKRFVQKYGYEDARLLGSWERYEVYEPILEDEEPADIGRPEFVFVFDDTIRMATESEAFAYMDSLPEDDDYEEIEEVEEDAGPVAKTFLEVLKFNPYHDSRGRFASANGGGGAAAPAATAEQEAKRLVTKAKEREPELTSMLNGCATEAGGEMVGLAYAVKGEGSLTRKIETEMAEKGVTAEEAAASMRDVNRYTMQLTEDNFVAGYNGTMEVLRKQGYEVARVKNTLANPNAEYRGVNTNIKSPDGSVWELQFHTAKSLEVKEVNHKLYEKQRLDTTPAAERAALGKQMAENAASIPTPKGIESIGK